MRLHAVVGVLASLLLISCGAIKPKERHVKEYSLQLQTEDEKTRSTFAELVARFNADAGFNALHLAEDGNSPVAFPTLLKDSDGRIGYGSWRTSRTVTHKNGRPIATISYAMELEFDANFVRRHVSNWDNPTNRNELYLLFCHEVGHGLQMNHVVDDLDVMNEIVYWHDDIKFSDYFASVRTFFDAG